MLPRGLRNNNPGNLRHSANGKLLAPYIGEIRPIKDDSFRTFSRIEFGYRALFHQIERYLKRGVNTIDKIITTYAPGNENNTEAYILAVTKSTGRNRNEILKPDESDLVPLIAAISKHENGVTPNLSEIRAGWNLLEPGANQKKNFSPLILAILAATLIFYAVNKSNPS